MTYFPVFTKINPDERVLIAGGGKVAGRKLGVLLSFDMAVDVIAGAFDEELRSLAADHPSVRLIQTDCMMFEIPADVTYRFAIAATDDDAVNRGFAERCRGRYIPVNIVDAPEECDFIFPSIVKKGPLVCAVSSGGSCPPATQFFRDRIAGILPDDLEDTMEEMGRLRDRLRKENPDHRQRASVIYNELAGRYPWKSE